MIKTPFTSANAFILACIGRIHAVPAFLPLLALALAPLDQADAILINPESYGDSQVQVTAPNGSFAFTVSDREVFPGGDTKKFDHETHATFSNQDGTATSDATWTFKSNPNKTIYGGSYVLDATGTRQSLAQIGTELSFTLLEPASYSISASFVGFFTPHEPSDSAALMFVGLDRFDPFGRLEAASDRNFAGGTFQLALGGPDLTGTLEPGDYRFGFSNVLSVVGVATGTGQFELSLDRLHVPDAGSTLLLLGGALGALGFIRHRI